MNGAAALGSAPRLMYRPRSALAGKRATRWSPGQQRRRRLCGNASRGRTTRCVCHPAGRQRLARPRAHAACWWRHVSAPSSSTWARRSCTDGTRRSSSLWAHRTRYAAPHHPSSRARCPVRGACRRVAERGCSAALRRRSGGPRPAPCRRRCSHEVLRVSHQNELAILEFIHSFAEAMDRYFENVCELDIM